MTLIIQIKFFNFLKTQDLVIVFNYFIKVDDEINSIIACLEFIISNSCCYDISENILTKELIDLGLPKENVEQIVKLYKTNKDKLRLK